MVPKAGVAAGLMSEGEPKVGAAPVPKGAEDGVLNSVALLSEADTATCPKGVLGWAPNGEGVVAWVERNGEAAGAAVEVAGVEGVWNILAPAPNRVGGLAPNELEVEGTGTGEAGFAAMLYFLRKLAISSSSRPLYLVSTSSTV